MSEDAVGHRLRRARLRRGISLRAFAAAVDVSPGLISQIENGRAQPSMATLFSIVNELGISYDELLAPTGGPGAREEAPDPGIAFQRGADAPVLELGNGVRWQRLAASDGATPDAVMVTYAPGGFTSSQGAEMSHSGMELVVVLEGRLTLQLDGRTRLLEAGDSVRFDAAHPHVYRNDGETEARGLWLVASLPLALQPIRAGVRKSSASSAAPSAAAEAPAEVGDAQAMTPSGRTSTAPSEPIP